MTSQREWQEIVAFGMTHVAEPNRVRVRELLHSDHAFIQAMDEYFLGRTESSVTKNKVVAAVKGIEAAL